MYCVMCCSRNVTFSSYIFLSNRYWVIPQCIVIGTNLAAIYY